MAGRKSKTAAAAKPKSKAKAGAKSAAQKGKSARPDPATVKSRKKPTAGVKGLKKVKKTASVKTDAKKSAVKKPAAKKPAVKKALAKKTVVKKTVAKKTVAKKPAIKKSAAQKAASKAASPKTSLAKKKVAAKKKAVTKAKPISAGKKREDELHAELARMSSYIAAAKMEIASIRPHDVKEEFLPKATDELDAIIEATADATNTIMDSCELVEGVMGGVTPDVSAVLMDATTRIYEACTFQDITGQRIGKVVGVLKSIEERIDALLLTFDDDGIGEPKAVQATPNTPETDEPKWTDEDLLEGPQLGGKAKSQAEIDDLLASFD